MFLVLILLLIGGLITAPLLAHMGTGIIAGEVYERRTAELYAADAGVEDAIWKIQNQVGQLPCNPSMVWSYNITDADGGVAEVNDEHVEVSIAYVDGQTYRILSTATGDSSETQIEAYVTAVSGDFSSITDHILCSQGELEWGEKVALNYTEGHGPEDYYEGPWPTPKQLVIFYWEDVEDETHYDGDTEIDLEGNSCPPGPIYINDQENNSWPSGLGPLSINGTLDILNSSNDDATLTLTGTIYITGDTLIGQNGKEFNLDLNGQTIFVESSSADAIIVGGKCTVSGPGAIIAVGDVYFAPKGDVGGNEEPVFIFSISGKTILQPSGVFYGAIAGNFEVDVQQGHNPKIIYPPDGFGDDDLNFPGFGDVKPVNYSIYSWEVSQQ